ncbi:MAG TPA: DUF4350 domain-containing protein [Candidatus Acidoferrales bacterium]|nr:DUF4350 domain-containing protein [Candidatus Acidoferrales bacterium]
MPYGLDRNDRKLLIGVGVLFVVLVVVSTIISPPQITGASSIPSSYSPSWDGAKGAFLLLQELGYDVSRWERSPTDLPLNASNEVLILAEPAQAPSEEERFAISEFVQNGGRVVATGASASEFLPEASKFEQGDTFEDKKSFHALVPSPIVRGAPQITMTAPENWVPVPPRQIVLYGNDETAAVVSYRFGKGQIIWWAAPTPLTNGSIRDSGNLVFFLNCIGAPGRVHVLWDEYFHGVRGSLLVFLVHTPVFWGVGQLALVFLAILFTYSRRLGPIRPPVTQSRLSPLEFVDTLGDLYASAHVASAAIGIAYQRFRFILTRKLGLPVNASVSDLAKSASESLRWEEAPLLHTLTQCELASKDENSHAEDSHIEAPVQLVQQLHDYSARLEVKQSTQGKGKQNE